MNGSSKEPKRPNSFSHAEPLEFNLDLQMKIMRLMGLWQDDELGSGVMWKFYPYFRLLVLGVVLIHLITMAIGTAHYWGDFANMAMILSMVLSYIEVSFKVIDAYLYRDKIEGLISTLLEDFPTVKILYGPERNEIIKDYSSVAKKMCQTYILLGIVAGGTWAAEPILDMVMHKVLHPGEEHDWTLPFMAWFPFNEQATPFYQLAYLFQAAAAFVGTGVTVAADMLFISLMIFTAGHLRLLGKSLEKVYDRVRNAQHHRQYRGEIRELSAQLATDIEQVNAQQQEEDLYNFLVACIKHHKSIISFASELEKIISPVMLFQFLATTLEICLAGFQAKLGDTMGPSFFKFMLYTASNIIQTFCYCKFGDNIVVESNKLTSSIYNSEWYEGSEKFKKSLRILLLRSQNPIRLWAGKFYAVSLETFSNLMHHSYSFFTLLSQMHE